MPRNPNTQRVAAGALGTSVEVIGDENLVKSLDRMGDKMVKKSARKVVTATTKPLIKALRTKTPMSKASKSRPELGKRLLKRSMGRKIKQYAKDGVTTSNVGPRTKFKATIKGERSEFTGPARYAHLVEFGHRKFPRHKARPPKGSIQLRRIGLRANGRPYKQVEANIVRSVGFVKANPFIRDTFKAQKGKIKRDFRTALNKEVKDLAAESKRSEESRVTS